MTPCRKIRRDGVAAGAEVVLVIFPVAVRVPGNKRPVTRIGFEGVAVPGHDGP